MGSANTPTSLSFTRETFAKLSPHPFLLAHLQPPTSSTSSSSRANGRAPNQFRAPHINNGSLTHAEGSAVVRIGDTTVVCGVRGEILLASNVAGGVPRIDRSEASRTESRSSFSRLNNSEVAKELNLLVPNIELATGCSPNFLPGLPPTVLAQSLSTRIYALLHSSHLIDSKDLMIWYQTPDLHDPDEKMNEDNYVKTTEETEEIKGFWTLYIDILFISLDGNPFDAAWIAVLSALRDTRLPKAYWDPDLELILCHDEVSKSKKLELRGLPIATTVLIFRSREQSHYQSRDRVHWILVDPDAFEESLCDETVTVVLDLSANECKILGLSKIGGTVAGPKQIKSIVSSAEKRWRELQKVLSS